MQDNAGKTTLLYRLKVRDVPRVSKCSPREHVLLTQFTDRRGGDNDSNNWF